ncbi:DUF2892 domain-containing protein [Bradyrhizobium lablabi]|uniref:YgaP family membrane protein n=1 Tax=Bradyrhizobium lablabi TaxID=722472 RepID=UPI001BA4A009|nr:DUF2892 domain-containing protein [Bradyrhizobium lablabi]MBR0697844.1 DUF2892 domain-containing protein [Bradyrhizobium lablabi]
MTRNVGRLDQYVRIVIGLALIAYAVKDGSLGPGWLVAGAVGLVLLATAFISYCPLYTLLGVDTRRRPDPV